MRRRKSELYAFAYQLNCNLPKSEQWFWDKWKKADMADQFDYPNKPRFGFIPDVINMVYKYIIEVDGSIHDNLKQQLKDNFKDSVFLKRGYVVVRVKAYCDKSFDECVTVIKERRESSGKVESIKEKKYRRIKLRGQIKENKNKKTILRKEAAKERRQKRMSLGKLTIEEIRELSKQRNSKPDLYAMRQRVAMAKLKKV